ncbi:drug/metabolite transporter, DME family [Thermomonospora echinospora]|uniref:Drug/metabolite transporter, DME family n=1 Tax=Thermomonospora echinospora TaxID=1992 RepID=A0A1H5S9N0_9ACTN|nr:EamA family transporter [Thermomonospora echinospora]SEF47316.1 drug/metabolite transporter, DME family [Thermomonospora echinospora]
MSTRLIDSTGSAVPARRQAGSAYILLAASLWGTTGTVRTLAPAEADPVSVGAARMVLGGAVLMLVAALARDTAGVAGRPATMARGEGLRRLLTRRRTWWLLALGAVCAAVYQSAFFAAVARTGVATGTVVTIGSAPAFTGLIALATGGPRPTWRWAAATACAVAGCAALVGGGRSAGVEPLGVALALLSGFTYAVYATVASWFITRREDDRAVVGVLFGGAAVLLLPVLVAGSPGWLLTASGTLVTVYLGVITTSGAYLMYARGLRGTPVTTATTLTLAEPAVAAVLGLLVLHERLGGVALAGLGLLSAGLLLLILAERR